MWLHSQFLFNIFIDPYSLIFPFRAWSLHKVLLSIPNVVMLRDRRGGGGTNDHPIFFSTFFGCWVEEGQIKKSRVRVGGKGVYVY